MKIRRTATVAAAAALALVLAACSKLTLAHYDRVKVGMPYEEVVGLLGEPARCNETLGVRACQWGDDQRSADITFAGGKVLLASAKNLK
ncbi:MAG TPA: hypothetical protein VNV16_01830 [Methylibium sp.]|nr:hypothetical protein [Methylibium sp.]